MIAPMSSANPSLTVYGIPNCDTVKKARRWLDEHGLAHQFHDFKKQGLDAATVQAWTQQLPWEQLLNKRGTTWRGLPADAQASAVDASSAARLMSAHPSLVKRPVVAWPDGRLSVGFDAGDWAARAAQP
jgi:Spx/MgsR family transcriptional regulator